MTGTEEIWGRTGQEPDGAEAALRSGRHIRRAISEPAGFVDPKTIGLHGDRIVAPLVRVQVPDQPGVLHELTRVIFEHCANIVYVDIRCQRGHR